MKKAQPIIVTLKKGKQELRLDYNELRKSVLVLRALGHKLRRQMIGLLEEGERMSVTDIYVRLRLEQSVASQHLAILRRSGIVNTIRQGKYIYYSLGASKLAKTNDLIEDLSDKPEKQPKDAAKKSGAFNEQKLKVGAALLRAMAHTLRLKIIDFIDKNKAVNVNKIYNTLKLEQSITSQHLRVLRNAGVVDTRREGKYVLYTLQYDKIANMLKALETFLQ